MNPGNRRGLQVIACLMLAVAVAGEAIASHALPARVDPTLVLRFERAMQYLIVHALALLALAPQLRNPVQRIAIAALLLGVVLFSGSLALSVVWPQAGLTAAAPFGGSLIIFSWLALAVGFALARR